MLKSHKIHSQRCFYFFLIIHFWLHWVSIDACRLSLVVRSGDYSNYGLRALDCRLSNTSLVAPRHVESSGTKD